ncbi:MAG: hypothetical protein AB1529_06685 [Candidatus Micrarchaeota archaeon]
MRQFIAIAALVLLIGCASQGPDSRTTASRSEALPSGAVKMAPSSDLYPPILHAEGWEAPVPVPGPINTAGAEDSPFATPDGGTLYFFFTPDPNIPPEKQLLDNVTGIWVSEKRGGAWDEPERVVLQEPGKLALDGCEFVQNDVMWFCSAREGYSGINLFTARRAGGKWGGIAYAGDVLMKDYQAGEMHLSADGNELFFHSGRSGGKGGLDLWMSRRSDAGWGEPENLAVLNSADNEGWPYLSQDGTELWFTRFYQGSPAIYRSMQANGSWAEPELIVSQFAGEPTLDNAGNLYFTHHYYKDGKMLEADIYVAYKIG